MSSEEGGAPIEAAIGRLGNAPLTADNVAHHIRPLFSRVLRENADRIYLANHSLGRPLDATDGDVREGLAAWYGRLGHAWDAWSAEVAAYRARLAALLGVDRPDAVIPKTSAGQGLRAVLNTYDARIAVVATRGEFDSIDVILREYARRGRVELTIVEPDVEGMFAAADVRRAIGRAPTLVVLSAVMFQTGQRLPELADVVAESHRRGAKVLLDVYHALGVVPLDLTALDVDFALGGSYKYLRGGPGACFLYVHPRELDAGLRTLDIGWFAKEAAFEYARPDPPRLGPGGEAWLESTPPVLPFYQARAGQRFTAAVGVERLRAYSLGQQRRLVGLLAQGGVSARGGTADHGAFVAIRDQKAREAVHRLAAKGVIADARGAWLRLCPDVLTTDAELVTAAAAAADALR